MSNTPTGNFKVEWKRDCETNLDLTKAGDGSLQATAYVSFNLTKRADDVEKLVLIYPPDWKTTHVHVSPGERRTVHVSKDFTIRALAFTSDGRSWHWKHKIEVPTK